jgi:septal ring factor EnvC (AmiA/AmiB activator)
MTNISTGSGEPESKNPSTEFTAVIKSGDPSVQRLKEGSNSVVSNIAVERSVESLSFQSEVASDAVSIDPAQSPIDEATRAATQTAQTLESLEVAVAKVDALVQSVEQRQSEIEDAHSKAKAMLDEVNRIAEALTFSNALRDRINATVARTKRLRGNDGNPLG